MHNELQDRSLEVYIYGINSASIRDLNGDLDIANSKWNFLFDFLIYQSRNFYFLGERLEYRDDNFESLVRDLSDRLININFEDRKVLFKLKPASLEISRSRLSSLFMYFEYPAIIFGTEIDESELFQLYMQPVSYDELIGAVGDASILHRNFESNVLWIKVSPKTPDIRILFDSRIIKQ